MMDTTIITIDQRQIDMLSTTILYSDARAFVEEHPLPKQNQLMGLQQFSRTWRELKQYIKRQRGRDWGNDENTPAFYEALRLYLFEGHGSKPPLTKRITDEFKVFDPAHMTKQQRQDTTEAWAKALAAEFINHLTSEALFVSKGGRP